MEGVQIRVRNFAGRKDQYNLSGKRTFLVLLNDDVAQAMAADGWNVKYLQPKEEGDSPQAFLKVTVNMVNEPKPRVVLVTQNGKTRLDESTVDILDHVVLSNVDLIINPYYYDFNGLQGYSAYLKTGFFTMEEDDLEKKYADVADTEENRMVLEAFDKDDV
jgi:hypothetical protein